MSRSMAERSWEWMRRHAGVIAAVAVFAAIVALNAGLAMAQDPVTEGETTPGGESLLSWLYASLGPMYAIIFVTLSFLLVALLVMNFLAHRRENFVPVQLVDMFEQHIKEKRYQEAYELCKNDESMLGKILAAGLAKLSQGYEQALQAMQEVGGDENMKLDQKLGYVALIASLAPMCGLLGTVDGMVGSFDVIATSPTQPKPSELATGISRALVTTLLGLYIAIPAIAVYTIMRNRLNRMVYEVGVLSEGLMSRFQNVGKK